MYVYVFHQYTYCNTHNCKVGVSKNPEKRRFDYGCGGFAFYKKYLMPSREAAFHLEALVCRSFPKKQGRELLAAPAEEVCRFIERHYPTYGATQ